MPGSWGSPSTGSSSGNPRRSPHPGGSAPRADPDPVPPRQGEGWSEEGEGDEGPALVLSLEGADEDREGDQGQEEEEGEAHPPAQLADEAAPEEEREGRGEDEDDAEVRLQGAFFSAAAIFAITLWWRP